MGHEIHYQCPECDADMTDQVYRQCILSSQVFRPLMAEVGVQQMRKEESAPSVMLQCPKGHWADYRCPPTHGGKS